MEDMSAAGGWEMVVAMMPEAVPPLKSVVKETCVDTDNDEVGAVKPPKEHAIVAAHQFRWLISQVLERNHVVIKLSWIRKSPYTSRLVDELVLLYEESATRRSHEVMQNHILEILALLQKCKGQQFEDAWKKHEVDPDLTMLLSCFNQLCTKNSSPGC